MVVFASSMSWTQAKTASYIDRASTMDQQYVVDAAPEGLRIWWGRDNLMLEAGWRWVQVDVEPDIRLQSGDWPGLVIRVATDPHRVFRYVPFGRGALFPLNSDATRAVAERIRAMRTAALAASSVAE